MVTKDRECGIGNTSGLTIGTCTLLQDGTVKMDLVGEVNHGEPFTVYAKAPALMNGLRSQYLIITIQEP